MSRKNGILTGVEVEELFKAAVGMTEGARKAYSAKHLQLKLHVIESPFISFVRTWRNSGLFVEDAVESLHGLVNKLNRRFCCMHGALKTESKLEALDVLRRPDMMQKIEDRKARTSHGPNKKPKATETGPQKSP